MGREIKVGDVVSVPCRHCAALSIKLTVEPGERRRRCPSCRKETRFRIRPTAGNCEIRSEASQQ
jgi:hypothetical protein